MRKTECSYCGETHQIKGHGYTPIKLNFFGLCPSCALQFPNGCNGITFENDYDRYVRMLELSENLNSQKTRYYDIDWLPSIFK
jgi:hypothetical protein